MATNVDLYWDGNYFCSATAMFTDPDLTTYAPTKWYAFQGYKRYWDATLMVLGPCIICN